MERDYIQRRNPPLGQPSRRRPVRRKRRGPPPFFILALILIVLIVVVVLIVTLGGREDEPEIETSSAVFSSAPVSDAPVSSDPEPTSAPTPTPAPPARDPDSAPELHDTLISVDGAAYEYYKFDEDAAKRYIDAVTAGANHISGATLYSVIIPTSMDVMLSDAYLDNHQINSSNQRSAIQWINDSFNAINPSIKTVPIFDSLKSHNGEYIYFRTDRHWTQRGAYYGYAEFCKAKGIEAIPLDNFDKKEYDGYLGSFYETLYDSEMSSDPDTVEAYLSDADTSLSYTDGSGNRVDGWPVIMNGDGYDSSYLYYIFCAANQPYKVLENDDLDDGSACVVVMESFGNVFLPYLTSHYQKVYAIDYRYYGGSVSQLVSDTGAKDVIVITHIGATSDEDLISDLEDVL